MTTSIETEPTKDTYDYENTYITDFEDLGIKENLLRSIYSYGFETPSVIQQRAIMPIIRKKDIIGQAQSGTGKTATFTIGVLERINEELDETQAIILTHTRELATQVKNVVTSLSTHMNISINLSVGGTHVKDNINELLNKPKLIIGTPGRVLDMINKKALNTRHLKVLVVDEADEMLSKIFLNQIYDIFRFLPNDIQVALFSATMPTEFFELTKRFMRDPVRILVKKEELTLEGIKQYYIDVERNEYKFDTICDLYSKFSLSQTIIYCNSKKIVDNLSFKLNQSNFSVTKMHGEMEQSERNKIMDSFRQGENRILVTTDLLSRGIDVQQVSIVINYDIPYNIESYIHRIGRSGRFGRKGMALNFVTQYDISKLGEIEKYYSTSIEQLPDLGLISFS